MKAFLKNQSKPVFKPSVFSEGMRQLRLLGIIFAAVSAVLTVFNIMDYGFYGSDYQKEYVIAGGVTSYLSDFTAMIAVCSSIFIVAASLYITQFLRSAKARDFYCSTPNSVGTVWLNFALAVYAWNLIGLLAGHIIYGLYIIVHDVKTLGVCLQAFAGNFAFSLLVFGIIMLSITLTGRIVNAVAAAVGLAVLPSLVWAAFHASLMNYFSLFGFLKYSEGLTCPDPFASVLYAFNLYDGAVQYAVSDYTSAFHILCGGVPIFYCLVMGIVYLAAAALFASVRTGDTVGRPFVNKAAHILALLFMTVPMMCFAANLASNLLAIQIGYFFGETLVEWLLVALVLVALFWLSELLLTFDIRHSHRAFKYLPVPVAIAAVLFGLGYAKTSAEMTTTVKPEDVESFSLVRNSYLNDNLAIFRMSETYGRTVTEDSSFRDAEIIKYVAAKINDYVSIYKEDPDDAYRMGSSMFYENDYYYDDEEYDELEESSRNFINIRLNLKNGQSITRAVRFDNPQMEKLAAAIRGDKEYMQKFLALPDADRLNIDVEVRGLTASETTEIYKSFVEEYNALTDEQKFEFLKGNVYSDYDYGGNDSSLVYSYDGYEDAVEITPIDETKIDDLPVSSSDIKLMNKSTEPGNYVIDACDYRPGVSALGDKDIILDVAGYADGHLYDDRYHFAQNFLVNLKTMPKTHALIVKTCNAKAAETAEALMHAQKSRTVVILSTEYYTAKDYVNLIYELVTNKNESYYYEGNYWEYDYSAYYDEDSGEYKKRDIKTIEVDANAMAEKLIRDIAAAGETVDFSKPYCVVRVYGENGYRRMVDRQFFVQTEFEIIK